MLLRLLCGALIGLLRSKARREAEILVLRHQVNVLRRKSPNRPALSHVDRLLFVLLSRLVPTTLDALTVVRPGTVIRWNRAGFRAYWRWKSRPRGGRPRTPHEIRQLIRDMSIANPLRLHKPELVKKFVLTNRRTELFRCLNSYLISESADRKVSHEDTCRLRDIL
jgi:hypothetical protein